MIGYWVELTLMLHTSSVIRGGSRSSDAADEGGVRNQGQLGVDAETADRRASENDLEHKVDFRLATSMENAPAASL
jgi:hypothetical protein